MSSLNRRTLIGSLAAAAALGSLAVAPAALAATTATTTTDLFLRASASWSATRSIVIPSGSTVSVTGAAVNGWLPVAYAGRTGWIHQDFLKMGAAPAALSATTTTDLFLRAIASWSATRSIVIPSGSTVSVTGAAVNGWLPVAYAGRTGWIHQDFLKMGAAPAPAPAAPAVTHTISPQANLRAGAGSSYAVIRLLPEGTAVSATGIVSGSYRQVIHAGTTGWVHEYHLQPITSTKPAPTDARATTGTLKALSFSYGGRSSRYHVIAEGIDWARPVGVVFYLDGDYSYKSRSRGYNPDLPAFIAMAAEANRRNLLFVPLDTPDVSRSGLGYTWWYKMDENAAYFRAFARKINQTYRIDMGRQWLYGYSGGAELISIGLLNQYQSDWGFAGGGAIILAGGGEPHTYTAPSAAYKAAMRATWVVGSRDVAGQTDPPTWSASTAASAGSSFYRAKGYTNAQMKVLDGLSHLDYDLADVMRSPLDAAGLTRLR